jgi:hypothetical protein
VGWPGGRGRLPLHWRKGERFWVHFGEADQASTHHRLLLGTENPAKAASVSITCEVNPPLEGVNRKCAGAFLRDAAGRIYLAHSGRIACGSGRTGAALFRTSFAGANWTSVEWPRAGLDDMHVIAPIEGKRLLAQLAYFVHEVARIKTAARNGDAAGDALIPPQRFRTEYARARRPPARIGAIEAQCDRGIVLASLHDQLLTRGLRVASAGAPDLGILDRSGRVKSVIAVTADRSRAAVHAALGRLTLGEGARDARRVLVTPGPIPTDLSAALAAADVLPVIYHWRRGRPVAPLAAFDPG